MTTVEAPRPTADPNAWRSETPGTADWPRTARAGDPNKYFLLSTDSHAQEPLDLWASRIEPQYRDRIPRQIVDEDGVRWQVAEGYRPVKVRDLHLEGEDQLRTDAGYTIPDRIRDLDEDGVDVELIFPNRGLAMYATPDPLLAQAQCRIWNDYAHETFSGYRDRMVPVAAISPADMAGSLKEIERAVDMGLRCVTMPNRPIWGAGDGSESNYNLKEYEPLWDALQDADLPVAIHISTGKDPRGARGRGGAVINYAVHALGQSLEPVVNICASGVLEKYPRLRFATIEAGIGWIAWACTAMDEAYFKHHMYAFPRMESLPSEHFKRSFFASFGEDPPGLALGREFGLMQTYMWANDYPHAEGTWPHSAEAIERTMGDLSDEERAQVLGLNALRFLGLEIGPDRRLVGG